MYDFGARYYDPVLGRWHSIDPQASSFAGMSPYTGMGNNPIIISRSRWGVYSPDHWGINRRYN